MKHLTLNQLPVESVSHNRNIAKKVLLRKGDLPHLTHFAQATFAPGQISPRHAHGDMCEVFFVQSGRGTIAIDDRSFQLAPGVCLAVDPHEMHEIHNNGTAPLVLLYFGLQV